MGLMCIECGEDKLWILLTLTLFSTILIIGILDFYPNLNFPINFPYVDGNILFSKFLYILIIVLVGGFITLLGFKELIFEKKFSIEILMALSAFGALYIGFYFEAVIVLFLFSLSEYLENFIKDRVKKYVESLSKLLPNRARVLIEGGEEYVDLDRVSLGDVILVKPGERIPLDGIVIDGQSMIDQSIVTGESIPIMVKPGDNVYAGTLNIDGVIKVCVNKKLEESFVSKIINLIIEAKSKKANVERLIDKFSKFYVPIILLSSLLTFILGPLIFGGSINSWIYKSLILIVISCPSAFVISVPATIFISIITASRCGILIKGGIYLENMSKVKAILFDKTGTLTLGFPKIHHIKTINDFDEILMYAAALEKFSNHPVARAIVEEASKRNLNFERLIVEGVKEFPGEGILGYVNGLEVIIGNLNLMSKLSCTCSDINIISNDDNHMFICVAVNKSIMASICFFDDIREDAKSTIESLTSLGINPILVTGDRSDIAINIANMIGINEVYANLSPEEKLNIIKNVKSKYGFIAMVGDGVNDAPSLAASDVGIAMGGGVDVALDSADIILIKNELISIPYLVRLSRKTIDITRQNILISVIMKLLLALLGFLGFIPLWFTMAVGDDGLTLLVILNSLRLTKFKQ